MIASAQILAIITYDTFRFKCFLNGNTNAMNRSKEMVMRDKTPAKIHIT